MVRGVRSEVHSRPFTDPVCSTLDRLSSSQGSFFLAGPEAFLCSGIVRGFDGVLALFDTLLGVPDILQAKKTAPREVVG